jgi:tetratricopeptide (TPR) repeat protein
VDEPQETETVGSEPTPLGRGRTWVAGYLVAERYEVREFLGSGGYGLVYRAYDRLLRIEVALKAVHPEHDPARALLRLRREVGIARESLSPHLVRVFDLGRTDAHIYLTMELLGGGSLRRQLDAGPLSATEAARIARAVLQGLSALHAQGAVHRDVTPGNILFSEKGEVKLADFGLVRWSGRDETALTVGDVVLGTMGYRSPEQTLGKEVGPPGDLYALGVVLFEMLTGRLPHEASSEFGRRLSVLERAPDVRSSRPEVPRWLARIVARLLEVRLADRYQDAKECLGDISEEKSPRRVRLRRRLFRAAAVLLFCLPPAGVLVTRSPHAAFSHLVPAGETGVKAVSRSGETLWTIPDVDPSIADRFALARIRPGGPRLIAIVLVRPQRWMPEDISTLVFLDPESGDVVRRVRLPSGANSFPNDPPRFNVSSTKAVDLFNDGMDDVIVNYSHVPEAPFYAILYSPRYDQARMVFYSRGGQDFQTAVDLDGDGVKELLFAGINNGWNWVNTVAAVQFDPDSLKDGGRTTIPAAPDVAVEQQQQRMLLWYAILPRGHFEDLSRIAVDAKRRLLTIRYRSGKTSTLGFDGFPPVGSDAERAEGQIFRRATYEHLREAERLRRAEALDLAMSEASKAVESAKRSREPWLGQYAERLRAKVLVGMGEIQEAEALFISLANRAEDAPEVAYDAAVAFHLKGDLRRAVAWYERGIGRESSIGAGKSKHEFLKGEVLALVEEKRYSEALAAVDRYGAIYPPFQDVLWLYREYIRWRAGEKPQLNATEIPANWPDLERYWLLEFLFARGGNPQETLQKVDRFLAERPETRIETLSLRAELLARLGRLQEASEVARAALVAIDSERARSIVARGHHDLLAARVRRLQGEIHRGVPPSPGAAP